MGANAAFSRNATEREAVASNVSNLKLFPNEPRTVYKAKRPVKLCLRRYEVRADFSGD
jgi:hypothetical protein